jgi:hypothetical protein
VDANEDSQGRTRFVLETSGYAVLSAPSVYAAAEVAHNAPREIALLLGFSPLSDSYLRDMGKYLRCNTLFVCLNDDGTRPDMQAVLEGIKRFLPPGTVKSLNRSPMHRAYLLLCLPSLVHAQSILSPAPAPITITVHLCPAKADTQACRAKLAEWQRFKDEAELNALILDDFRDARAQKVTPATRQRILALARKLAKEYDQ